jgi:hypothetical protein
MKHIHTQNQMKPTFTIKPAGQFLRKLAITAIFAALWNLAGQAQSTFAVYDTADSFVLNPGAGNTSAYPNAASQNFGGMNSRSVASATAHPGNNSANAAKGEFDSVLRFDLSAAVAALNTEYGVGDWSISALTLTLNTSSTVGNSMFNSPGTSGSFDISWMSDDGGWVQGTGTQSPASYTGITYDSLQTTLSTTPATLLNSASYVAAGTLVPETFSVGVSDADFLAALLAGDSISLLLTPADSQVAFNFTSHSYGGGSNPALYSPTLTLTVVPEPAPLALLAGGLGLLCVRLRRKL